MWNQQGRQQQLSSLAKYLWHKEQARRAGSRPLLQSVWANMHTGVGNAILGPQWQHLHGCSESWCAPLAVVPALAVGPALVGACTMRGHTARL